MHQQAGDIDAKSAGATEMDAGDAGGGDVGAQIPVPPDEAPVEPAPISGSQRPRRVDRLTWTARQRRGMAVVLTLVLGVLIWRAIQNTSYISDPQPARPARFDDLADRFDPNTATWQELAAIPSLGEKRARAIVDHRADWQKRHPGKAPYREPLDLAAVSGIGATMIEQMMPHLTFPAGPATEPTIQPAK